MTTKLLICGSRDASPWMIDLARHCVKRAQVNGYHVIVGDASGVDEAVVLYCLALDVEFTVFGITPQPRFSRKDRFVFDHIPYVRCMPLPGWSPAFAFIQRNKVMCNVSDQIFAIWNGTSRGTKQCYNYAVTTRGLVPHKTAWMRTVAV